MTTDVQVYNNLFRLIRSSNPSVRQRVMHRLRETAKAKEIVIGVNLDTGEVFSIPVQALQANSTHIISASGRGKTSLMKSMICQLIPLNTGGGLVIDPEHSLYKDLMNWAASHPNREELAKRIIPISPSEAKATGMWAGYSPTRHTDNSPPLSVHAESLREAMVKTWGENTDAMPRYRKWAGNAATVALETKLTFQEMEYLVSLDDSVAHVRRKLVEQTHTATVRRQFMAVHNAKSTKMKADEWGSLESRLTEFGRNECINLIMRHDNTMDIPALVEGGYWVFLDVSRDQALLGRDHGRILATCFLSDITDYALTRSEAAGKAKPFFVFVDEFEEYVISSDVNTLLDRCRKRGIHLIMAHQTLDQIREGNRKLFSSVIGNSDNKIVLGLNNPDDAEYAVRYLFPDIELKEVKDEVRLPMTVRYQEETTVTRSETSGWAEGTAFGDASTSGSGSSQIATPSGEVMLVTNHSVSDGGSTASIFMQNGSTGTTWGTRLRPVLEELRTGTQFFSLEEQRARKVANLLDLPPQHAYIRLSRGNATLVEIGTVRSYPDDEKNLQAWRQLYLSNHPEVFLPEQEVLIETAGRRQALEAEEYEDEFELLGDTNAPVFPATHRKKDMEVVSQPLLVPEPTTKPEDVKRAKRSKAPVSQEKVVSEPEPVPEPEITPRGAKRGRPRKVPLPQQVQEAYGKLPSLDWLQECQLAHRPELQEHVQPRQAMAQGQALRHLLIEAAQQVAGILAQVPDKEKISIFLGKYAQGKTISKIAGEMGVTRKSVYTYRDEGFKYASEQFVLLISHEP